MGRVAYPLSGTRPPCLPPKERVNATAPPRTETALSIPLGLPCKTFSAKKAYPSIKSVSVLENLSFWGFEMIEWARRSDDAAQVENAAEDPSPAPIGRFADAVNVTPGLVVSFITSARGRGSLRVLITSTNHHVQVQERHSRSKLPLISIPIIGDFLNRAQ
jgi:hypothetical protein